MSIESKELNAAYGLELKGRLTDAISVADPEAAADVLSEINTALLLPKLGHFQPGEYLRAQLIEELSAFCSGRTIRATIYMGDGGYSRLSIEKQKDGRELELGLHLVPYETTIQRWKALSLGEVVSRSF